MALQTSWVDRIHARLLVRYGAAWLRMWEGIDPEAVKADWAEVLRGASTRAILHALDHLHPERPPTAAQFAELCGRCPAAPQLALPAPPADRQRVAEVMARVSRGGGGDPQAKFLDLKAREDRGEKLTWAQREMWRAGLRRHGVTQEDAA